jgi:hypothetical protein
MTVAFAGLGAHIGAIYQVVQEDRLISAQGG